MRVLLSLLLLFSFSVVSFGQEPSAQPLVAPGGLRVVPPYIDYESITNRVPIPELLARLPEPDPELKGDVRFDKEIWAREIRVARDVWCLQFSFKDVRIIDVDIPNAEGKFDKKKVWYLVYSVKNLGPAEIVDGRIVHANSSFGSAVPAGAEINLPMQQIKTSEAVMPLVVRQQSGVFAAESGDGGAIRFVPHFVLATHRLVLGAVPVVDPQTGRTEWQTETMPVAYDDRIIPLALPRIMRRERFDKLPETTVSIAQKEIAPGQEVWGVAMWTDVDPRMNEFSIFISGLTNAYQWGNRMSEDGTFENTGTIGEGRMIKRRVLKTDWWRVGDARTLDESQIHFGGREGTMPSSPFDQTGRLTAEERRTLEEHTQKADLDGDGIVTPAEKALHHLINQDWLKPTFGYEWIFL